MLNTLHNHSKYLISIKLSILISKYLIKTKTTSIYGFDIWYITCKVIGGIRLMHPLPRPAAVMYFRTGGRGAHLEQKILAAAKCGGKSHFW